MYRLRYAVVVFGVALLFAATTAGQDKAGQEKKDDQTKAKGVLPANWGKLGLTDDQKQKVYRVQTAYRTKIDDLQKKVNDLKTEEKDEMMKVLTEQQKALTEQQKATAASLQAFLDSMRKAGNGDARAPGGARASIRDTGTGRARRSARRLTGTRRRPGSSRRPCRSRRCRTR
jgi:Spy/CpxP family protein refolding chaperone